MDILIKHYEVKTFLKMKRMQELIFHKYNL